MQACLALCLAVVLRWVKAQDSVCASNPCLHGGVCTEQLWKVSTYSCNCSSEWTGQNCEQDVDECTSSPCKNMGLCINKEQGFTCNCLPQWIGPTCERPSQCGPQLYSGWPSQKKSISGPVFTQANFTDRLLPYICSYTIQNLQKTGKVQLIFDDFLMSGSKTRQPCMWSYDKNGIEVYDGESASPVIEQCFASYKRPGALISTENSLRIEFKHWSSIAFQFPVFRAHYRFLSASEQAFKPIVDTLAFFDDRQSQFATVLWQPETHDMLWLFVAPKKKHVFLSLNPIFKSDSIIITLDIHDGITSDAPKNHSLHYKYQFPTLEMISTGNGLYVRCFTNRLVNQNVTVAGMFVFFSKAESQELCSDFWCANKRCISSALECDGINHCGDNSDEKPCLGLCPEHWCANGGTCHEVISGYPRCSCQPNFSGDRCQEEEVCPKDYCMNGGICLGSSVSTRYCLCQRPYSGVNCQQDNSGCPHHYCQNGGSCEGTHELYNCKCPADFTGTYCEFKYVETYEDESFLNNLTYTLITVIPIAILLVMIWVCCRMRNCSFYPLNTRRSLVERELRRRERECEMRRREMRESLSVSDNPSTVSRSLSRMSSVSMYTDEPPPYNVVVRSQRRKLRRHHSHPGPTHSSNEEPPPSYESVVIFLNGGQQTDPPPYIRVLQRSQSRGRRRSLESSQTALEGDTALQTRLSSVTTTGGDWSPEQSQRASGWEVGRHSLERETGQGSVVRELGLSSQGQQEGQSSTGRQQHQSSSGRQQGQSSSGQQQDQRSSEGQQGQSSSRQQQGQSSSGLPDLNTTEDRGRKDVEENPEHISLLPGGGTDSY
ncbi:uncharacterized protein LOC117307151 [Asterias rubens]|uniref:uncharacterized protein LOC117307151 n=1 Tax=Asterias rubens TaxID=7604 RepID=UPI001455D965|nr:uncharacterized protein LOC117307151 [Asterias rubens]